MPTDMYRDISSLIAYCIQEALDQASETIRWQYMTVPASYNSTGYAIIRIERTSGLIQEYSVFGDTWKKYGA